MLKNHLTIALRNLTRNKATSAIKIFSLCVGLVSFAIISLHVFHELSFDRFHWQPEQVFRIVKDFVNDDGSRIPDATTPPALGPAVLRDIPEVAYATRLFPGWGRKYLFQYAGKRFLEERVLRVDSSFFDVFTFPFVKGEPRGSFNDLNSVLLTETSARKYFGDDDPMGKVIKTDVGELMVTGILKDIPSNSHFHFDFLISVRKIGGSIDADWNYYNFYTYVRLKHNADPSAFQDKLQPLFEKYQPNNNNQYYAQALTDIHLRSNLKWELAANGDYTYIRILITIAVCAVLLAVINYINLVTAQSARRAKEVGIRKVSGAVEISLMIQFLFESLIMSVTASILSAALAEAALPLFQNLFSSNLSFFTREHGVVLWTLLGVGVVTGLFAGLYPAFYLSSFKPVSVLKGKIRGPAGEVFLRKGLVTFQFTISTVLIIGTFVISRQLDFVRKKKLGFDKENVLVINNAADLTNIDQLLTEIRRISGVENAGASDGLIGGYNWTTIMRAKGQENSHVINFLSVDHNFIDVMGVNVIDGRNFSPLNPGDSIAIILNETAVKQLGISGPVIGSQVGSLGIDNEGDPYYRAVIGVVEDFHFTSFHEPIKPFALLLMPWRLNTLFVRISGENLSTSIANIEALWNDRVPDRPFEFTLQDEQVAKLYSSEVKFLDLFSSFTYVSIIIACVGLFGLSAYTVQQRNKEIGIRKVLGASVLGVTQLLSREFLKLVLLGIAISIPIAWYVMRAWLENFAYRVELTVWVFIMSGFTAIFIALLTVSFQSIKAALANPVKALRSE